MVLILPVSIQWYRLPVQEIADWVSHLPKERGYMLPYLYLPNQAWVTESLNLSLRVATNGDCQRCLVGSNSLNLSSGTVDLLASLSLH